MGRTLREFWREWSSGPGPVPLGLAFAVLGLLCLASGVVAFREATTRGRNPFGFGLIVLWAPLVLVLPGVAMPGSFPYWGLAGLALSPLAAFVGVKMLRTTTGSCPEAHPLSPRWAFCPACPSPTTSVPSTPGGFQETTYVGRNVGTILRSPRPAPLLPSPGRATNSVVDDVLLRLVPEGAVGEGDVAVRRPGAVIGRNPSADIYIDDPTVSWEHARIVTRSGSPTIIDLDSSNGTFVNGEQVSDSLLLADDRVQFGDVVFRVVKL